MGFEQPKFESSEVPDERLNEEEAHEEANMLRAKMKFDARAQLASGEKGGPEREATTKDYDEALKELEELEKQAAQDPSAIQKFMKKASVGVLGAALPGVILGSVLAEVLNRASGGETRGNKETITDPISIFNDFRKREILTEARKKLEILRTEGERIGEDEIEADRH